MKKNYLIYMLGEVLNKVFPFLLLPFVSNNFGASALLEYSNVVLIFTFSSMVVSIPFVSYLSTFYFKSNVRFKTSLGVTTFICKIQNLSLLVFFPVFIYVFFVDFDLRSVYFSSFLIGMLSISNPILLSIFQVRSQSLYYVFWSSLRNLFFAFFLVLIFLFHEITLNFILFLFVFSAALVNFISYIFLSRVQSCFRTRVVDKLILFRYILRFGLPLLPSAILTPLRTVFDRFLLVSAFGSHIAGVYAGYYQLATIIVLISSSQVRSISPELLGALKSQDFQTFFRKVRTGIVILFSFAFISSMLCFIFGGWFLGKEFEGYEFFASLPFFFFFQCSAGYFTCFYQFFNMTDFLMKYSLFSLALYFSLTYFSSFYSWEAFVVAMLLSSAAFFVFSIYKVKNHAVIKGAK